MSNFSMTCLRKSSPLEVLEVWAIDYEKKYVYTKGGEDIDFDDILWLKQGKTNK